MDALSHPLLFSTALNPTADHPTVLMAAVQVEEQSAQGREDSLDKRQRKDSQLLPVILYLESGVLLKD